MISGILIIYQVLKLEKGKTTTHLRNKVAQCGAAKQQHEASKPLGAYQNRGSSLAAFTRSSLARRKRVQMPVEAFSRAIPHRLRFLPMGVVFHSQQGRCLRQKFRRRGVMVEPRRRRPLLLELRLGAGSCALKLHRLEASFSFPRLFFCGHGDVCVALFGREEVFDFKHDWIRVEKTDAREKFVVEKLETLSFLYSGDNLVRTGEVRRSK